MFAEDTKVFQEIRSNDIYNYKLYKTIMVSVVKLNLPIWVYRCLRLRGDMIEMFKMVSGAYDEQVMQDVVTAEECSYKTRGHSYKLPRTNNKTWLRQHYFREKITCF